MFTGSVVETHPGGGDGVLVAAGGGDADAEDLDLATGRLVYKRTLLTGAVFTKYGRHGFPHARRVWLAPDCRHLLWGPPGPGGRAREGEAIPVAAIVEVLQGPRTPVFQANRRWYRRAELCLSVVAAARSLDLEAPTQEALREWVLALRCLRRYGEHI